MNIKLFLCSLLIIATTSVYSQGTYQRLLNRSIKYYPTCRDVGQKYAIDTCNLFVTYQYSYVVDTVGMSKYNEQVILEIGKNTNRFYSRYSDIRDSLMYNTLAKKTMQDGNSDGVADPARSFLRGNETAIYSDIYTFPKNNRRMGSLRVGNLEYQYKEELEQLNWNILPETDTILSYVCQKAETEFRGRKWYAWFSMELPYNFGPWKLNGLPGLILKAIDSEGLFVWNAIGIEQPRDYSIYSYSEVLKPSFPRHGRSISKFKVKECSRKDVAKLWQRQWVAGSTMHFIHGGVPVINVRDKSGKTSKIKINMNDLPDIYYPKLELDL